ncbi:MAG: DUF4430 domain-containing protein [Firmicutes bacterium]|nr:DUF4430 domain-containing protein [Bacillota bacterium]
MKGKWKLLAALLALALVMGLWLLPVAALAEEESGTKESSPNAANAPHIIDDFEKEYETVTLNQVITLSVSSEGDNLHYQWKKGTKISNLTNIDGANDRCYTPDTTSSGNYLYQVEISNEAGITNSSVICVSVLPDDIKDVKLVLSTGTDFQSIVYGSNHKVSARLTNTESGQIKFIDTAKNTNSTWSKQPLVEYYANSVIVGEHTQYVQARIKVGNTYYYFESDHITYLVNSPIIPTDNDGYLINQPVFGFGVLIDKTIPVSLHKTEYIPNDNVTKYTVLLNNEKDNETIKLKFYLTGNSQQSVGSFINMPIIGNGTSISECLNNQILEKEIELTNGEAKCEFIVCWDQNNGAGVQLMRYQIYFTNTEAFFYDGDIITNLSTDCGMWENNKRPIRNNNAYLILPYENTTASVTFTIGSGAVDIVGGIKINDGEIIEKNGTTITANLTGTKMGEVYSIQPVTTEGKAAGKPYRICCISQRYTGLPNRVIDYLCIGSQYTNTSNYGGSGLKSLVGSNYDANNDDPSGPVSLGNFGGYITYYYENAIKDDPANPYGIDFIIFGNSVDGSNNFAEPGQVWVSEDGTDWYALAGSLHYDDNTLWDYSITYSPTENGATKWQDSLQRTAILDDYAYPLPAAYGWHTFSDEDKNSITLKGIYLGNEDDKNEYGNILPPFPDFGYADVGTKGTIFEGEDFSEESEDAQQQAYSRNLATNPYLGTYIKYNTEFRRDTDGMDLAWAVDSSGKPVKFENGIHYIKIVTAINIVNGAIGEKSTEINMMRIAQSAAGDVGQTAAPQSITIDGKPVSLTDGQTVYDSIPVSGPFSVEVTASEDANVYINSERAAFSKFDGMPGHQIVRVIVQEGEKAPWIGYFALTEGEAVPTCTLTFVDGNVTTTGVYDEQLDGIELPKKANTATKEFIGWQYGLKIYTNYVHGEIPDGATLTAVWNKIETPVEEEPITVSFRLVGSTLADSDINLSNGNYQGAEYQTWIPTTQYTVSSNATVLDVLETAADAAGLTLKNQGNYIESITVSEAMGGYELGEFTNGPRSGWMYQLRHAGETAYHHGKNGVGSGTFAGRG